MILIAILILHWLGDFVFQTRWMADNKSKSIYALSEHVFVYTLVLGMGLYIGSIWTGVSGQDVLFFSLTNGLWHWCTDFSTSKLTSMYYKRGDIHSFFVIIGLDQMIHIVTFLLMLRSYGWRYDP